MRLEQNVFGTDINIWRGFGLLQLIIPTTMKAWVVMHNGDSWHG